MVKPKRRTIRTEVETDRFMELARPMGYLLVNGFLIQHAAISEALQMRPAKMLVFVTIVAATVQRFMRQTELPQELLGTGPISRDFIGYISRRGIAAATKLPRENVRRIVEELMQEGLLIIDARGRVANKGQILARPEIIVALLKILSEVGQQTQKLVDAGVLTVKQDG